MFCLDYIPGVEGITKNTSIEHLNRLIFANEYAQKPAYSPSKALL
ncbi:hypothetical protein BLL52_3221 [Rhodoferax antarcticus ANT.BR]|uniref:Uncharacterized protein n=1 Tax=Rhodoferax antarcticus ANT.BR TaxID=1111071 RepID=A0A1Q8YC29_9BURK|nr:hypothetical protein BLL52_3221 [Rhodoferax antarcticus ANT.BR]